MTVAGPLRLQRRRVGKGNGVAIHGGGGGDIVGGAAILPRPDGRLLLGDGGGGGGRDRGHGGRSSGRSRPAVPWSRLGSRRNGSILK